MIIKLIATAPRINAYSTEDWPRRLRLNLCRASGTALLRFIVPPVFDVAVTYVPKDLFPKIRAALRICSSTGVEIDLPAYPMPLSEPWNRALWLPIYVERPQYLYIAGRICQELTAASTRNPHLFDGMVAESAANGLLSV